MRDGGKFACKPPVMGQMFKINAVIFKPADSLQRGIDLSWVYSFIVGLIFKCGAWIWVDQPPLDSPFETCLSVGVGRLKNWLKLYKYIII